MATRRYAAFLRGVSPMNAKMPALKKCFEDAGFTDVSTLLSSGNVVFSAKSASPEAIARKAEKAMATDLDRSFFTIVRAVDDLAHLVETDPFQRFRLAANGKRIVTFLSDKPSRIPSLPIKLDSAAILAVEGDEVLSVYTPSPKGPVFMTLIEKTFGQDVTTRTWDTVKKVVRAGLASATKAAAKPASPTPKRRASKKKAAGEAKKKR